MEYAGGNHVGSRLRIYIYQRGYPCWFLAKDKPRRVNEITANVHQGTAPVCQYVANIFQITIVITEISHDGLDRADSPFLDKIKRAAPLRMSANHKGLFDLDAGAIAGL